jgi:hypothetical protein
MWIRHDKKTGEREPVDRLTLVQRISVAYGVSPTEARSALSEVEVGRDGSVETVAAVYYYEVPK